MARNWNDDLTTGIAAIDGQHREFLVRMNEISEALEGGLSINAYRVE